MGSHHDDVEEEFRSCCEDEEWQDTEECLAELLSSDEEVEEDADDDDDDDGASSGESEDEDGVSLRVFFKGVSVSEGGGGLGAKASGIGVVMETSGGDSVFKVQKKLDFFVDVLVAEHLALLDGLIEAQRNGVQRIVALTDNEEVYHQIAEAVPHEDQLLVALGYRILELSNDFEAFVLKLVCRSELVRPLKLAREAVGILDASINQCLVCCCEEKQQSQIIKLKCSHSFCLNCMIVHVEGKLQALQVPIKCPQVRCKYHISKNAFKSFLPISCYQSLERATMEAKVLNLDRVYCPFPDCSVLFSPGQHSASRASSSNQYEINCVECQECCRLLCSSCGVPWHSSMSCEEYQSLSVEERDAGDANLLRLAQNNNWRRCQQCRRMVELTQGCFRVTCWCGHEFCYSCSAGYHSGTQTCQCTFWGDEQESSEPSTPSNHEADQWRWEPFDPLPSITDNYSEQERAQLALIQRFLAGGFGINDDHHHNQIQSPPRCSDSYLDAIKDLNQLPWLERFVSVISDSYHEDYIQ
ncbi:uncharacterized protein A4U43_C06F1010 [Asparagus officinalis]|uniref:RBR-type E3 ubiquitin transferase n=1 Tax=Asparagus officinalis TaxID=4686 RepID=A0A5P1EML2_ASPOF|nr:E3 ubiquitin-protein ligase arih1 [Asparagus officinalis]XP_020269526.1 E3 ubiquitin-protein ligase arih1 [Asparagus officinalis]ONK65791.1 uncharacterized protein A4U43_C06F1010 [Asparagus officinalis]